MKTLLMIGITLLMMSAQAQGNFNCSAQAKIDRNNSICSNSLISPSSNLKKHCAGFIKAKTSKDKTVR